MTDEENSRRESEVRAPWPTFSREPTGREGGRLDQGLEAERQKAVAVSAQAGRH